VLLQREQDSFGAAWRYSKRNRRKQDRGYQQVPLKNALSRVISIADGCLSYDFARDKLTQADIARMKAHEPLPEDYLSNVARVAKLQEQALEAEWLFPTLGVLSEELLKHDMEAVNTQFSAFNESSEASAGLQPSSQQR
jgi:hypothetical protein